MFTKQHVTTDDGILSRQTNRNRQARELEYIPDYDTRPAPITALDYGAMEQREDMEALRRANLTDKQRYLIRLYWDCKTISGVAKTLHRPYKGIYKEVAAALHIYKAERKRYDRWWVCCRLNGTPAHLPFVCFRSFMNLTARSALAWSYI